MKRWTRLEILGKLGAKIAAHKPIIGGGAGTGISAKCEEAGGIDLIVIYNSGRYRMAGRGSLAGLLAYGNANEIVVEWSTSGSFPAFYSVQTCKPLRWGASLKMYSNL